MNAFGIFLLLFVLTSSSFGRILNQCASLQRLEIGKPGTIECSFQDRFYAVLWYTPESYVTKAPLIGLVDGVKRGRGFSTGELDIREDGSLIIKNVTVQYDSNFTVSAFPSEERDNPIHESVKVVVVVKPPSAFPIIDICLNETICYTRLQRGAEVSCHISNSRPAVQLSWVARTHEGDLFIPSQSSIVTDNGSVFTSRATTKDVFYYSTFLSVLICKADDIHGIVLKNESSVFVENTEINLISRDPIVKYIKEKSTLKLVCSEENMTFIVWKKASRHDNVFQLLSYAAYFEKVISVPSSNNCILQDDGSLLVRGIESDDEGLYGCIYDNVGSRGAFLFDVIVYVPVRPVVGGCTHHEHCVLEAQREGILTCSVKGIRPKVQLRFETFSVHESSLISFTDHQVTTYSNGDVYDITLNSTYKVKDPSTTRITIKCTASMKSEEILELSAKFELFLYNDQQTHPSTSKRHLLWIFMTAIPICLFAAVVFALYALKGRRRKKRKTMGRTFYQGEGTVMTSRVLGQQEDPQTDLRSVFIKQLKTKYKYQYDAVQPIPYIRDRLYCVDRVFVEGGFEKLMSKTTIEGLGNWEKLTSYHDVTNFSSSSTRTIIEGDPGYGKSTLTLQLAYDWCNCNVTSPLADVDILILLRLRQLGGVHSLSRAIQQFILPRDSQLSETDIRTILQQSKSNVFILDGFDEYPEEETEDLNDVISTIRGEMFQENFVILTSRSFFLPKSYPPQTHRIRLTGFDSSARDAYIRKAVVGDNTKAAKKIKRSLQKNSVLQGLCQVPLFFVMFAHMTHESEKFLKFKSVTSFFQYIITCFHSHMKNKMEDRNVQKIDLHENNHASLDKVAFEGLSGKNQQIVWKKKDLIQRLGSDFYNQYRSIGILVEEEILDITDRPGDTQYKTEVRFYHKLFCEWYAAHYLCCEVVKQDTNLHKLLEYMNPFDLQYTYRFACGLDPNAGNKIIEYFRGAEDGDKFAVLCILEQSGNFDQIKETVQDLCSNYIIIDNTDSSLLQGSIVQLLEIGSSNQIPISFLWLKECFNSVDFYAGRILLKSELSIPALSSLQELVIGDRGRKFTSKELSAVITYSTMCSSLKSLRFCYLLMPNSIKKTLCASLQSRKIQVLWCTDEGDYLLNHQSGKWEPYDTRSARNFFEGNIPAKKNLLKILMKRKYKELTSAIEVIPSDSQNLFSVSEVFVNCGLQCLVIKDKDKRSQQWESMDSYQAIFTRNLSKCKRYVLEGKPGSGKSMLALRMAYDWCEGITQSPLSGFDLFMLVQFTPGNISKSIYTEIKRCVLPRDSPLSDIDIRGVLRECTSAVMVLDGLDLYAYEQTDEKCDLREIIRGKMLNNIAVITTCSFVPEDCAPGTNRIQLMGFDDVARDEYIRKVIAVDEEIDGDEIKQKLRDNLVLKEFISMPLVFTMFAHISKESNGFCETKTYSSSFTWLIECLHSHMKNQGKSYKEDELFTFEKPLLGKVAFEGLCCNYRSFVMERNRICELLGRECFEKCLRLGILLEGDIVKESNSNQHQREVTFYHELFSKWYAAHYIAEYATWEESDHMANVLTRLNEAVLRHICNFVGELNVNAVGSILRLLKSRKDYSQLSKLIVLENISDPGSIRDIVKDVCETGFQFTNRQEKPLQASMIHLLKLASKAKISILCVGLHKCYSAVDLRGGNHLQLKSNLSIPVLTTLNKLKINDSGREITSENFTDILKYSSKCLALKELEFIKCLLPPSFQAESASVLRSRNVRVTWGGYKAWHQLNLHSCLWELIDDIYSVTPRVLRVMTDDDYQNEVEYVRRQQKK